jgi:hypothetical protein
MCWRDDVIMTRHCGFCGQEYYGDLGHENCPKNKPARSHAKPKDKPPTARSTQKQKQKEEPPF